MGETILQIIMNIIITISEIFLSPFMNALYALFPSVSTYFSYINSYLIMAFTYVSTVLQWFLFTPAMFVLLFEYYVVKYAIHLLVLAIKFTVNIYNKLKP